MTAQKALQERLKVLTEETRDSDYTMSDTQQAKKIGINYNTFYKYLKGTAACPAHNLLKIADYYGVSTDYLLGRTNVRTTDTDIKAVCDYTGLSEKSIEFLHMLKFIGFTTKASDYACIIDILIENAYEHYKLDNESFHDPALLTLGLFLDIKSNNISVADIDNSGNVNPHESKNIFSYDKIRINDRIIENALLMELSQTLVEMKEQLNRKDGQ